MNGYKDVVNSLNYDEDKCHLSNTKYLAGSINKNKCLIIIFDSFHKDHLKPVNKNKYVQT